MKHRLISLFCTAALLAGLLLPLSGCAPQRKQYTASWFDVFDTVIMVTGYATGQAEWDKQSEALHADLLHYHQLLDIYNEYDGITNLATVNQNAATAPVAVHPDLYDFLKFGYEMYGATAGSCNIAAGAVLSLWHDARELEAPTPPAADDLTAAAQHCNITDLLLDDAAQTVAFADAELSLDVGAIGKGYAVEQAALAAEARGLDSALINAGGNVRAIGTKPGREKWTAGVENPWISGGPLVAAIELKPGESLVISGNYQRYFDYDGIRYHHLIDLSTNQPAHYVSSVAVRTTGGSGLADALSTGLFCSPVERGLDLVNARADGTQALWMYLPNPGEEVPADPQLAMTPGFSEN